MPPQAPMADNSSPQPTPPTSSMPPSPTMTDDSALELQLALALSLSTPSSVLTADDSSLQPILSPSGTPPSPTVTDESTLELQLAIALSLGTPSSAPTTNVRPLQPGSSTSTLDMPPSARMADDSPFQQPTRIALRAPFYFADVPWLGGTHDGFPILPIQDYIRERKAKHPHSPHTACQIQSLLIFGVLEAAMGVKVAERELLRRDEESGAVFVTAGNLPALLENWRRRSRGQTRTREDALSWVSSVMKALMGGSIMFETAVTKKAFEKVPAGADPLIAARLYTQAASILDILYTTSVFLTVQLPSHWQLPIIPAPRLPIYSPSARAISDKMATEGWCPFTLSILSEHPALISYVSTRTPQRGSVRGHCDCSPTNCSTNNIDTSNYKAVHVSSDCTCEWLKPSLSAVLDALAADKIPVVQLSPDGDHLITSNSSETTYVAISHVWADGLGSTTEDGLPRCQLQRIAELVQPLIPGGPFWMDSLCVPSIRETRRKAISLMAQTYRDAGQVLVLDAGIRQVSRSAGCVEKLFNIATSGWMQRLWTLQEGVLAQKLLFEFAGGPIDLDNLMEPAEATEELLSNAAFLYLSTDVNRLRHYRHASSSFTLTDAFVSLRWRATSRLSDETLAIAGLLDVDAGLFAAIPPEERLPTLLLQLGSIDDSLPFIYSTRLTTPCFRWALSTLMRHNPAKMSGTSRPLATCTSAGLLAEYFAFSFDEVRLDAGQPCIFVQNPVGEIYIALLVDAAGDASWTCNMILFVHDHLGGHTTSGVAALKYGSEQEEGGERYLCTYQVHLMVKDAESQFTDRRLLPELPVIKAAFERVKVRLD